MFDGVFEWDQPKNSSKHQKKRHILSIIIFCSQRLKGGYCEGQL